MATPKVKNYWSLIARDRRKRLDAKHQIQAAKTTINFVLSVAVLFLIFYGFGLVYMWLTK